MSRLLLGLTAALHLLGNSPTLAATSIGTQEASPAASSSASVPVVVESETAVAAVQADVLFDPDLYEVTLVSPDAENSVVDSRVISEGRLRVVVFPSGSNLLANGSIFRIPLTAKSGVVEDFPVVLTDFLLVGSDAAPLTTSIAPRVKLLGLRDGKEYNGRVGLELTAVALATAGTISRVQYFAGGVLIGEGAGANFRLVWVPGVSGPFEITAVALDSNGNVADSRTVPVVVSHVGTFAGAVKGTYVGLLRADAITRATSGYVSMTSSTNSSFTVNVKMGGLSYAGSGKFDATGQALVQFSRPRPQTKLSLQLTQSSNAAVDQIHGKLTDGTIAGPAVTGSTFVTEFTVDRVVWSTARKPVNYGGLYTLLMPANDDAAIQKAPLGTGYRTLNVNTTTGSASLGGKLADGTAVTQSTYVSKDGRIPVYNSLYVNTGMISSWLTLQETVGVSDGDGTQDWHRAANTKAAQFKDGFTTQVPLVASKYIKPAKFTRYMTLANLGGNVQMEFNDGGLLAPLTRLGTMNSAHVTKVPLQGPEKLTLTATTSNGLFAGSFVHPHTGKSTAYSGAVLQKQNLGSGFILSGALGGNVSIGPNDQYNLTPDDALPLGSPVLPVVTIKLPTAEKVLPAGTATIAVSGTASDAQGIQSVQCQVLHNGVLSTPVAATGTTAWTFAVPVPSGEGGRYTIFAKALDTLGNESEVATVGCWVSLVKPLAVAVAGPGKVSTGYVGTSNREVGKIYTITATPNAKKKFTGWTGDLTSSSPSLTFMMTENLTLTANFID